FGHTPNMVTASIKSGTNEYHGDVFEFLRNDKLDARNFFYQAPAGSAQSKDILKRNQFGGTFGGPLKKNKTFFFGRVRRKHSQPGPGVQQRGSEHGHAEW